MNRSPEGPNQALAVVSGLAGARFGLTADAKSNLTATAMPVRERGLGP